MNIKPKTLWFALGLLTATLFAGGQAFAQSTVTEVQSFTGLSDQDPNPVFNFAGFDTSLGSLTSVQIGMTNFAIGAGISVTNLNTTGDENFTVSATGNYNISDNFGTGSPTSNVQLSITSATQNFTAVAPGTTDSTGPVTDPPLGPLTGTQGAGVVGPTVDPSQFSHYENTSTTVALTLTAFSGLNASVNSPTHGATHAQEDFSTLTNGTLEIIFTYTPVPEPRETAALLMGFALCLLFGRKFLRKRSA